MVLLSVFILDVLTGHHRPHLQNPALISITQIKNDWHSFRHHARTNWTVSAQQPLLSSDSLPENIKTQSISSVAALYHHLGLKQPVKSRSSQQDLYDAFESVALCNLRAKENCPLTACRLYPHLAEGITCTFMKLQLVPDWTDKELFHLAAVSSSRKLPVESSLDESSKVIYRRTRRVTQSVELRMLR